MFENEAEVQIQIHREIVVYKLSKNFVIISLNIF